MKDFKNFVIFLLSLLLLMQSVFLVYLLSQRRPVISKREVRRRVAPEAPVRQPKPLEEVKPAVQERPTPGIKPLKIQGKIAIVIDDWGYNLKNKDFITDDDFHVTISILPFKVYSTQIAQFAYHRNKDVLIHMPMEPHQKENYGLEENTLLIGMDKKTIGGLLDRAFDDVPYAKGLSNHMGSKATEDAKFMRIVLEYLKGRGLFFLDSVVTPQSVCPKLTKKFKVGFAERDVFIDNDSEPAYIQQQMIKLAQKAKRTGVAIGVGHDRVATISVLREMIPRLEGEGYQFVNLSEIIASEDH